ncbi:MAG: DUF1697 domain-containing protein [Candidatus Saccharimonadales bacterium]
MIYLALLRGINVGGKAKVEMARLKSCFEAIGCRQVSTYINSGNVIFEDKRSAKQLGGIVETAINQSFGLNVRVVIRQADNIRKLCQEIPDSWTNDSRQKTDVLFLWEEIDDRSILEKVKINPAIERVRYFSGALVWNIGRADVTRGGGIKLIKSDFYRHMTARNINIVRKLDELMQAATNQA